MSRETFLELTTNIESQEFRRRQNRSIGTKNTRELVQPTTWSSFLASVYATWATASHSESSSTVGRELLCESFIIIEPANDMYWYAQQNETKSFST